jgi:TonB family protein
LVSVAVTMTLASPARVFAQTLESVPFTKPVDLNRRVFVDVNQVIPREVLAELAPVIAVRFEPSPHLPDTPLTLRMWNVRARTALDALCDMVGCRWQVEGRTLRVGPGEPPPPVPRSAEFFVKLKKPLEGPKWKFVRVPLRDVVAALSKAVGGEIDFQNADLDTPVTADLTGETPFRAAFKVMSAIGWDNRGVGWDGVIDPNGPIVLRLKGWPKIDTNPPLRTPTDRVYEKDERGLTMPKVISMARPAYTRETMEAKIEGTVTVSGVVEIDGTVGDVKVLTPLHPDLDKDAVRAARDSRFVPGMKDGKPVPVRITLELTFTLR